MFTSLTAQAGEVRTWDSELLLNTLTSCVALARWTALRVAWHVSVLPSDTLMWHYEDLEVYLVLSVVYLEVLVVPTHHPPSDCHSPTHPPTNPPTNPPNPTSLRSWLSSQ